MVGFGHTTGRARPVDDTDPVGSDQNIAAVKVTVAQAIAGRQPAENPQRECPQLRRQDGVFDAGGQDLAKVRKISRGLDTVDGKAGLGQRPRQAEHPPRLALHQRQHVRPSQTLQHQAWVAIAVHDVDQPRGDAVTVQPRQCHRLRTVPEVSGTVELDDRVVTPRVYLGLAALASLGPDHFSASDGRPVSQSVTGLRARTRSTVPALSRSASTMSNPAARTSGSCRRVKCSPAARMVSHSRSHCAA